MENLPELGTEIPVSQVAVSGTDDNLIKLYQMVIEELAAFKSDHFFDNSGKDHAAIVMSNIYKQSKQCVRMLSTDWNGQVSSSEYYLIGLKQFLRHPDSEFEIIFQSEPNKESDAYKLLKEYIQRNSKIKIYKLNADKVKPFDFMIGDDRMVRVEEDKSNYKAICNFNNAEMAYKLNKIFDNLKSFSEDISPQN